MTFSTHMTPIITSLLDNDLYKFTMMQAVLHQYPAAQVTYEFTCRNETKLAHCIEDITDQAQALCRLKLTEDELNYLKSLHYIKSDFIDFLRLFKLDMRFLTITLKGSTMHLRIKGPWLHTILFEVPLLAIISEVYSRYASPSPDMEHAKEKLNAKIKMIQQYPHRQSYRLTEFGTRRRFSKAWHRTVVLSLAKQIPECFPGTSNLLLAKELNLIPFGTMAHEYLQAHQALGPRLVDSQKHALESWVKEYRGNLGIALTDVVGMQAFIKDFDLYFTKLFDGIRHDSGDPFEWAKMAIDHYKKLKIDPLTKHLIFSDTLTVEKSLMIHKKLHQQAKIAFGIGTNLTHDVGMKALQSVIKMVECNGQPVAKISDSPEKLICHSRPYLAYLKKVFHLD
jgi:nicotinate phosphoribosyltransferase